MRFRTWLFFLAAVIYFPSCSSTRKLKTVDTIHSLNLIGRFDLPHKMRFDTTTVGGLSGIDYDARRNRYYLICDDRSALAPARFYTARIDLRNSGIDTVELQSVVYLRQPDGSLFPSFKEDPSHTPDPECLRYDPFHDRLVWGSEGERIVRREGAILQDPSLQVITREGKYLDSFPLPDNLHLHTADKGPRQNGVFEGLCFSPDGKSMMVSVEEPLYEDGPRAGLGDSTGWIRILRFDLRTRKPGAQYAYRIDPVAYPASPASAFKINGVPDILMINDHQLLVLERSFSTGRRGCVVRLYLADLQGATDVSALSSLSAAPFHALSKKLLLNFEDLGIYIDNVEGVCLGPRLPNGKQSLLCVADDNFAADEVTQFFLFEIQ